MAINVRSCFFTTLSALCLTIGFAGAASAQEMFVTLGEDGTISVTDRRPANAKEKGYRPYTPGSVSPDALEAWALGQKGHAHAGLAPARQPFSGRIPARKITPYDALIDSKARRYGVPVSLVRAVVAVESGFNAKAKSRAGAQGLMQLMPPTAADLGVTDAFDPEQNVDAGTRYLAMLLRTFKREDLALAAYNAGPGRVRRAGGIPAIAETQSYVKRVLQLRKAYAQQR